MTAEADHAPTRELPLPAAERIEALDVLRGTALFGIFIMNMPGFTHSLFTPPPPPDGGLDGWVVVLRELDAFVDVGARVLPAHQVLGGRKEEEQPHECESGDGKEDHGREFHDGLETPPATGANEHPERQNAYDDCGYH